jgi:hypothetical protein
MTTSTWDTIQLGDLVLAAFDEAATYSTDPHEVSRRAAHTVNDLLRWAPRTVERIRRRATRDRQEAGDGRATG